MLGNTVCADPTGAEGDGPAIARFDLTDGAAGLLDDSGALMAEHGRQGHRERAGHPHEVRVAKTDTHNTNSHLIWARCVETQLLESELTHRCTDNGRRDQHQTLSFNMFSPNGTSRVELPTTSCGSGSAGVWVPR